MLLETVAFVFRIFYIMLMTTFTPGLTGAALCGIVIYVLVRVNFFLTIAPQLVGVLNITDKAGILSGARQSRAIYRHSPVSSVKSMRS